jgi:hypothetical protein
MTKKSAIKELNFYHFNSKIGQFNSKIGDFLKNNYTYIVNEIRSTDKYVWKITNKTKKYNFSKIYPPFAPKKKIGHPIIMGVCVSENERAFWKA